MNNICAHDFNGLLVVSALWDDEVSIALGRLNELFMHRFEYIKIAIKHHLCCPASLYCIALYDADKALVRVGIDKYLQVHEVAQLLLPERHNTFDDDDLAGLYMHGLGQTVTDEVTVCGLFDALSLSQGLYLLGEKLPVEGVGMVEVDVFALLWCEVRSVVVVGILWNKRHPICRKRFENLLHDCCLAGTCAAGDADDVPLSIIYGPPLSPPNGSDLKSPLGEVW